MFGRITCIKTLQLSTVHQTVLRNVSVLVVKRGKSTAAQTLTDDNRTAAKPYEAIPGPKPFPFLGNTPRFFPGIGDLRDLMKPEFHKVLHKKYGNIMKITGIPGRNDTVMVFDPDDIEKVYRNEGQWPIRSTIQCAEHYRMVTRKDWFQGVAGLFLLKGEDWQKFRSKVNQTMLQPRSTKLYISPIDKVANDFIERILYLRDDKQEMPADFNNELNKWALESIVYIALDTRLGCLKKDLEPDSEPQKMIEVVRIQFNSMHKMELGAPFWKIMSTPTWRNFVKATDFNFQTSMKYINEAMIRLKSLPEDSERELTILEKILASDPDPKTAVVMALDMMGAGIDTTANATALALYYIAKHPQQQQKLFEELKKYLPTKSQELTSDILNELKYLKACIKESMRLSPIAVGNQRELVKDMILSGYQVPKGASIFMPLMYLSNMEKYYSEADKFIPERWLKDDSQSNMKVHPFVTLPFGFGSRMCVGRRFAELEIETLISKIIRNFRIEYNYADLKFAYNLLRIPASPLKFRLVDRES